jgi:hypothetical protein
MWKKTINGFYKERKANSPNGAAILNENGELDPSVIPPIYNTSFNQAEFYDDSTSVILQLKSIGESNNKNIAIPMATQTKAGIISASDKTKLDYLKVFSVNGKINDVNLTPDDLNLGNAVLDLKQERTSDDYYLQWQQGNGENKKLKLEIADTSRSGLMSLEDKTKLDWLTKNHNELQGLQGGTAGEFYHLTSQEAAKIQALPQIDAGSWTPQVTIGQGDASQTVKIGFYQKIGEIVAFSIRHFLYLNSTNTISLTFTIPILSNFTEDSDAQGTLTSCNGYGIVKAIPSSNYLLATFTPKQKYEAMIYISGMYKIK